MRRSDRKGDKRLPFFFEEGYLLANKVEPAIRSRDAGRGCRDAPQVLKINSPYLNQGGRSVLSH